MRTILHLLLGLALAIAVPASADTLAQLHKSFMERYDAANQSRDDQLKKLDASYLAALERQVEKNKATGKLDAVIPFFDEVQAVKTAKDPLPELPATAPAELKQMRAKHAEARDKILKSHAQAVSSLATKMETALKTQEAELTKAGKIDEALAAKHMRESLASDEGLVRAREQTASSKAGAAARDWRPLLSEPMEVTAKGMYELLTAAEAKPGTKIVDVLGGFVTNLKSLKEPPGQILIAIPNTTVDFKPAEPATRIRGKVHLANPGGSVHFKLHAGGKLVLEKILKGEAASEPFEASFPATKSIRLETDQMGAETHDWSAWIAPEIQ